VLDEHGLEKIEQVSTLSLLVRETPRDRICTGVVSIEHGFDTEDLSVIAEQDILCGKQSGADAIQISSVRPAC